MEIKTTFVSQWKTICRTKLYFIYVAFIFLCLAFIDNHLNFKLQSQSDIIYRYMLQQIIIIFTNILLVHKAMNEKVLRYYGEFLHLYNENKTSFYNGSVLLLIVVQVIPFIFGHLVEGIVNGFVTGKFMWTLCIVNILIVSMEIIASTLLATSLMLLTKKDILTYLLYYMIITLLLCCCNIYVSLPMPITLLEETGEAYYVSFDFPLWIGRILQVLVCTIVYFLSVKHIINKSDGRDGINEKV